MPPINHAAISSTVSSSSRSRAWNWPGSISSVSEDDDWPGRCGSESSPKMVGFSKDRRTAHQPTRARTTATRLEVTASGPEGRKCGGSGPRPASEGQHRGAVPARVEPASDAVCCGRMGHVRVAAELRGRGVRGTRSARTLIEAADLRTADGRTRRPDCLGSSTTRDAGGGGAPADRCC